MGADTFISFFGLRYILAEDELDLIESRHDPRIVSARRAGLDFYWGRLTDGAPFFLLIGKRIGIFGVENDAYLGLEMESIERLVQETRDKMVAAGLAGMPMFHFQLEADN